MEGIDMSDIIFYCKECGDIPEDTFQISIDIKTGAISVACSKKGHSLFMTQVIDILRAARRKERDMGRL